MPNPYKIVPENMKETLKDAIHVSARLLLLPSGYIFCDKEYNFKGRLTTSTGQRYAIDVVKDHYVEFLLVDKDGKEVELNTLIPKGNFVRNQLPSQLFEECMQGDSICFMLDGIKFVMKMDQSLLNLNPPAPLFNFTEALEQIRRSIQNGHAQYLCDRPKDDGAYEQLRTSVSRYGIFEHPNSPYRALPPFTRAEWKHPERMDISIQDFGSVPPPESELVDLQKYNVTQNNDGTLDLTLFLPGLSVVPNFKFIYTCLYVYAFVESPNPVISKKPYIGLVLKEPEFQNNIVYKRFEDGVLTLRTCPNEVEERVSSCRIV